MSGTGSHWDEWDGKSLRWDKLDGKSFDGDGMSRMDSGVFNVSSRCTNFVITDELQGNILFTLDFPCLKISGFICGRLMGVAEAHSFIRDIVQIVCALYVHRNPPQIHQCSFK